MSSKVINVLLRYLTIRFCIEDQLPCLEKIRDTEAMRLIPDAWRRHGKPRFLELGARSQQCVVRDQEANTCEQVESAQRKLDGLTLDLVLSSAHFERAQCGFTALNTLRSGNVEFGRHAFKVAGQPST